MSELAVIIIHWYSSPTVGSRRALRSTTGTSACYPSLSSSLPSNLGSGAERAGLAPARSARFSLCEAAMAIKRRAVWILGATLLAVMVSGVIVYASTTRGRPGFELESAAVDRGRIVARVTATGTLSPLVAVQVGSQVSGRIEAIFVDFGSPVKKGQVIAQIDRRMLRASAEQARANRTAAEGSLAKAEAQ